MRGTVEEASKKIEPGIMTYLLMMLPVVFWGISFTSTKVVLTELPPVSIAFFRQFIALVPLLSWIFVTKTSLKIKPHDIFVLAGSCFFGIVLYFVFENTGLLYTNASSAAMIVSAVPIFTLVSEAVFFRMRISLKTVICILISIFGVYLVISANGKLDFSSSTFLGNILILAAMISWVIYTLLSRGLGDRYVSLVITFYQTALSSILFIPFVIPEIERWKPLTPVPLLNLIYLSVFCSAISYFAFLYAVKRLGPTVSSAFLNLVPVVAVITGFMVLGERLWLLQYAGMGLIMYSLFTLNRKSKDRT